MGNKDPHPPILVQKYLKGSGRLTRSVLVRQNPRDFADPLKILIPDINITAASTAPTMAHTLAAPTTHQHHCGQHSPNYGPHTRSTYNTSTSLRPAQPQLWPTHSQHLQHINITATSTAPTMAHTLAAPTTHQHHCGQHSTNYDPHTRSTYNTSSSLRPAQPQLLPTHSQHLQHINTTAAPTMAHTRSTYNTSTSLQPAQHQLWPTHSKHLQHIIITAASTAPTMAHTLEAPTTHQHHCGQHSTNYGPHTRSTYNTSTSLRPAQHQLWPTHSKYLQHITTTAASTAPTMAHTLEAPTTHQHHCGQHSTNYGPHTRSTYNTSPPLSGSSHRQPMRDQDL